MLQQTKEDMRQYFIGTIADKHVARFDIAEIGGNGRFESLAIRVRIEPQAIANFAGNGFADLG